MTNEGTSDDASRWRADAAAYDDWFDQPWGRYASSVEHDLLLDAVGPVAGLEVCDAGCGTGRFMTRLEAAGARVVGVDADPVSLAVARTRVVGELIEGDVHRLPFDDSCFDATVAVTVCEFAADPAAVIADLVRVTRPGGRVVIGGLHRASPWGWWNRRQVSKPPWNTARFLAREDLERIARRCGATSWSHGLYAPAALPGLTQWGPLVERVGRRLAPRNAAFEVLTINIPDTPATRPAMPPFVTATDHDEPSVFQVENLLREARRQRNLDSTAVPMVCLLDPDGDVVRHLAPLGRVARHTNWACYHSELWTTDHDGLELGIVPCAVGAPYAVLVAEELAASGCELLVSVTSAGTIIPLDAPPYFVLIERAWRDEGTSHRYLPPGEWVTIPAHLADALDGAFNALGEPVHRGVSWTTDAPFRETATAIERARAAGVHAVEMEAAALYAYAEARQRDVVCVAHVTNSMAADGDDFEKGHDNGTDRILRLVAAIAVRLKVSVVNERGTTDGRALT
ncbi:MAG: methyltransferase domain-containing protein [Acidimicrobiia bacterium]